MNLPEEHFSFQIGANTLAATRTCVTGKKPTVLMLHGAGQSNRARTALVAQWLAERGVDSLRFDHSGHGESTGQMEKASLALRLEEARAACTFCAAGSLKVLGSSMGAHIAANLLATEEISHLVLVVPAAYTAKATSLPFNHTFKAALQEPYNWHSAPQWPLLQRYPGKLFLVTGGQDDIIPQDVVRHYWDNASLADRKHFYHPEAPHALLRWLESRNETALYRRILEEFFLT